jgi:hypothetical protein
VLQSKAAVFVSTLATALVVACSGANANPRGTTPSADETSGASAQLSPEQIEQMQIEAARRHPVAHPEPRSLYPEQSPPGVPEAAPSEQPPPNAAQVAQTQQAAPNATAPAASAPAPAQAQAQQPAPYNPSNLPPMPNDPAATTVEQRVVTQQQPPQLIDETAPPAPAPNYVWAPGYWYWYGGRYVWIAGGWLPPRPGYVYVGARWGCGPGGWAFSPGGWAVAGGGVVVYPLYRHRYLYDPWYEPWPYYRRSHYYAPPHRHYGYAPRYEHGHDHGYSRGWTRNEGHYQTERRYPAERQGPSNVGRGHSGHSGGGSHRVPAHRR